MEDNEGHGLVDRLKAASELDEGPSLAEARALFLEAADEIEQLRRLLDASIHGDRDLTAPKGRA
ncbi:hypothetical protein [Microvirga sp. 17 mud 1-3]|uniref:hypothetical protein n=1 Tax=Microvirga sp. 17 mud 1-3 TaxID=2082949 RepID=UPI000D6C5243|nr:hypothetical protein [Microvirga sp. 17 mud 1-3]AWM85471.1 hypothetical protein C4E04_01045 [Microvirga sp. 17 mud 1-3]